MTQPSSSIDAAYEQEGDGREGRNEEGKGELVTQKRTALSRALFPGSPLRSGENLGIRLPHSQASLPRSQASLLCESEIAGFLLVCIMLTEGRGLKMRINVFVCVQRYVCVCVCANLEKSHSSPFPPLSCRPEPPLREASS